MEEPGGSIFDSNPGYFLLLLTVDTDFMMGMKLDMKIILFYYDVNYEFSVSKTTFRFSKSSRVHARTTIQLRIFGARQLTVERRPSFKSF